MLPAVVVVLAALLGCGTAVSAQLRCLDAARAAARAAVRGEAAAQVVEAARRTAPPGAVVTFGRAGADQLAVEVSAPVTVLGVHLQARGRAVAAVEGDEQAVGP